MEFTRQIPPLKRVRYALETAAAYIAYGIFSMMRPETASDAGGAILRWLGPRMGASKRALRNISIAFPEKSEEEKKEILAGMWDNLGRVIAEYPHLAYIRDKMDLRDAGGATQGAGPRIFFAGHIANWETPGLGAGKIGMPASLVYRKPNNPWVDSLLRRARAAGAVTGYIPKGASGAREIVSILKKGGNIGMLTDQRLNEGMAIPFFGHDAMTADAPARFALKFKCPLYPLHVERLGPCRFRVTVLPPVDITDTGDYETDARRILTDMNGLLESWICAVPAHWLWTHRRWPESQ